jgi:hypothetical protein
MYIDHCISGADPGFQVKGGAHLKKLRRAEGVFGVFHVKNLDFMPKNNIFSNFRGGACPLDLSLNIYIGMSLRCLL